jgi:hypothetical protein
MQNAWREQMVEVLAGLGMSSIRELRGRSDLLRYISEEPAETGVVVNPAAAGEGATVGAGEPATAGAGAAR